MTVKDFYDRINGDYYAIKRLFPEDATILRFLKMFPSDSSIFEIEQAYVDGDLRGTFEAAHKLKGLASYLAFTDLDNSLGDLAEWIRFQKEPANPMLLQRVRDCYRRVIKEINRFLDSEIEL